MKKVIFMGTPMFAATILEGLIHDYQIVLVVSQPDKKKDRHGNSVFSPVKELALKYQIDLLQPDNINTIKDKLVSYQADIVVTAAFGQFISDDILNMCPYKAVNVHASLLPELRGGAPIHHAIIRGYKKTGVTIMRMVAQMDAGNIIAQREIPITIDDDLASLTTKLSYLGRDLLLQTLPLIFSGNYQEITQNEKYVTYGYNITKDDQQLDFNDYSLNIYNLIRGLSPIPGVTTIINGNTMKVYQSEIIKKHYSGNTGTIVEVIKEGFIVKTLDGGILIKEIQLSGKKRISAKDYLNGYKNKQELLGVKLK